MLSMYCFSNSTLDPQKNTLIFIHGAGGSHYMWDSQLSLTKEFNIITVDLPGHGKSVGEAAKTLKEYAQMIHALIEEKFSNLLPVAFVGHSMGGGIVQHYALLYSQDLLGIALIDTGAKMRVMEQILEQLPEKFENVIKLIVQYAFYRDTDPQIIQKTVEQFLRCSPTVLLQDFKACNVFNLFNEVKSISVPTLILCGTEDRLTPIKYSQYLHKNIPNSKFVEVPNAGHMTMLEKPEIVNQALKGFIKELEGP